MVGEAFLAFFVVVLLFSGLGAVVCIVAATETKVPHVRRTRIAAAVVLVVVCAVSAFLAALAG